MLRQIIDKVVAMRSLSSLFALANREGARNTTAACGGCRESGSPKSECFLGERKHSEALSFLSKAKKRLAELRADEAQWSKLCEVSNEQTILGTTRGLNISCFLNKVPSETVFCLWWVVLLRLFFGWIECCQAVEGPILVSQSETYRIRSIYRAEGISHDSISRPKGI